MDSIIAIELGILIVAALFRGSKAGELITAVESIGPQIKRLEQKLEGIESATRDLQPKYDINPNPYPDLPRD